MALVVVVLVATSCFGDYKTDSSVWCFYNQFGFDLSQLACNWSSSIGLLLSGFLCVVVDLGIERIRN